MEYNKVRLLPLTKDDIELVRTWRNDEKISRYMEYREHITIEMQQDWFRSISNDSNFYFIIMYGELKVGLANIKNIDWNKRCGEVGAFIYDDSYLNSLLPYIVSLKRLEMDFEEFGLHYVYAHILKTNKRAIRFNKSFGFQLVSNQEHIENQRYILTRENYEKSLKSLKPIIMKSIVT